MKIEDQVETLALEVATEVPSEMELDSCSEEPQAPGRPGIELCLRFEYSASHRPQVRMLLEEDRKKQTLMSQRPPRAAICLMADVLLQERKPTSILSPLLVESARLYLKERKAGAASLEVLAQLLFEAASLEQQDARRQRFLIFQALDMASLAIEISEDCLNPAAAKFCLQLLKVTKPLSPEVYSYEQQAYEEMTTVRLRRQGLGDLNLRNRLAQLYLKAGRYFEAYVQIMEFEKALAAQTSELSSGQRAELTFRKGLLLQQLIDFHAAALAGKKEQQRLLDCGKLRAFVQRYNLRHPDHPILPLQEHAPEAVRKTLFSLAQMANLHYAKALGEKAFTHSARAHTHMAQNHALRGEIDEALKHLSFGMEALKHTRSPTREKARQMVVILGLLEKQRRLQGHAEKAQICAERREELRQQLLLMEHAQKPGQPFS